MKKSFSYCLFAFLLQSFVVQAAVVLDLTNTTWLYKIPAAKEQFGTIAFGKNGKVSGFSGCNNFAGSYAMTGKYLRIKNLVMTRKACAQRAMTFEKIFLFRLQKTYWFKGTTNTMLLFNKNSDILLRLSGKN